eukprot:a345317_263.p1 GENE.a345317_263~~a345317_263.p1  ORF type:complete len:434 (+),score=196.47 a345317_263:67-1302(+)
MAAARAAPRRNINYPGAPEAEITTQFSFVIQQKPLPVFRMMNTSGEFEAGVDVPEIAKDKSLVLKMYEHMNMTQIMDTFMAKRQRQGSVSFYMTAYGEEATHIGSAAALKDEDVVYAQYRESGVLFWRGFTLDQAMAQCYSTVDDLGKGRQMPVHYGSRAQNFQTISSPLSTQIPQAAGAAYALKRAGKNAVCIVYFGDGAASEGDFHAALNFAATLDAPCLFFCRNNGYAISTPTRSQYRGDGIGARGIGYGIPTIRIDGNDIFAVHEAVARARADALAKSRPILIEAMTYRLGDHSSSDDSSRYRPSGERDSWLKHAPIPRLREYISKQGWWSEADEKALHDKLFDSLMTAMRKAQAAKKPSYKEMFTDVLEPLHPMHAEQLAELEAHLKIHGSEYGLSTFADEPAPRQ